MSKKTLGEQKITRNYWKEMAELAEEWNWKEMVKLAVSEPKIRA